MVIKKIEKNFFKSNNNYRHKSRKPKEINVGYNVIYKKRNRNETNYYPTPNVVKTN